MLNGRIFWCVVVFVVALIVSGYDSFSKEPTSAHYFAAVSKLFQASLEGTLNSARSGKNSVSPALLPLASTEVPPLSAGYAYVAFTNDPSDNECKKPSITVGIPVNTCTAVGTSSYKVLIVADNCEDATIQYFEGTTCSALVKEKRLDTSEYTACQPYGGERTVEVSEDVTVTLPLHHWKLHCTAQPTKPILVQSSALDLFGGPGACDEKAVGFVSIAQGVCFPVNGGRYSLTPRCAAGKVALAMSLDAVCSRPVASTPVADTCALVSGGLPGLARQQSVQRSAATTQATLDRGNGKPGRDNSGDESQDDDDDGEDGHHGRDHDHDHDQGGAGSGEDRGEGSEDDDDSLDGPSQDDEVAVVQLPAVTSYLASCAAPNTDYTALVSVSQVIQASSDLDAGYLQNPTRYSAVLQRAVANGISLPGVTAQDVHITGVTSAGPFLRSHSESARAIPASLAVTAVAPLAAGALQVQYMVLAYSAALTGGSVAAALQAAVSSGAFNSALQQFAQAMGLPGLSDASSSEVTVAALSDGSEGGNDENGEEGDGSQGEDSGLSASAVVGIVVAAVVAAVVLVAVMAHWCCGAKTTGKADYYDMEPTAPAAVAQPVTMVEGGSRGTVQTVIAVPVPAASAPPVRTYGAGAGGNGTRAAEPVALQAHAYRV